MNNKVTLIRVPAALTRTLEGVVATNEDLRKKCPSGHDVKVSIKIWYAPKGERGFSTKSDKVPVGLMRKLKAVVEKSGTVRRNCPFEHDVKLSVSVQYVHKGPPRIDFRAEMRRARVPKGPKLVRSEQEFGSEHFGMLLGSALHMRDKRFVLLFQERGNRPMAPIEWMRAGYNRVSHVQGINALCRRHRLPASFGRTGHYIMEDGVDFDRRELYKFYVMEPARRGRKARE